MKRRCYIGLGSNLDDPASHIRTALKELADLPRSELICASSLWQSVPMGPQDQPDYINAVALLETESDPFCLLKQLQQLEQQHHRIRKRHWGERTLDLDIVFIEDTSIESPDLTVPHPGLTERNFVLFPLAEVNPDLVINNCYVADLSRAAGQEGLKLLTY